MDMFMFFKGRIKRGQFYFNRDGFFLIETLLVIVILSVSLTLIVQSLLSDLRVMKYNKEFSQAGLLLENKISEVMAAESLEALFDENNFLKSKESTYQYVIEEEVISDEEGTILKEVKMKIFWDSGKRNNAITLGTYVFVDEKK